jgi:thiamine-phosphate pyrophosphorylase
MADKLARAGLARAALRFAHASGRGLPSLILMTDDERLSDPLAAAGHLPRGSMVIVRARRAVHRHKLAAALKPIARARGLKLLVADDPALASVIGADGIHLPQSHARQTSHWRARRPGWIITVATHTLRAPAATNADAVIVGPVFATASHPGAPTLGATQLRLFARRSPLPVYALGGIDAQTVQRLLGAKLAGLAAIGALAA